MATIVETEMASTAELAAATDSPSIADTPTTSGAPSPADRVDRLLRYAVPVATGLVGAGVVLRFVTSSQLWLDEALSVNIARLPIGQIPGALRHDGAPPLYYVILHFWMLVVGEGNVAVRALSGVISVASLPLAWFAGKRLGGRRMAWASLLLIASSPFAINYATATRMYALMMLWSLLGFIVLARALKKPTTQRLAGLSGVTALILYTHYWGMYLVAVTGLWLLLRGPRAGDVIAQARALLSAHGPRTSDKTAALAPATAPVSAPAPIVAAAEAAERPPSPEELAGRAAWSCFVAMVFGSLAFLPWLPSFVYQTLHTGTPWSNAAGLGDILTVLGQYAGGGPWGAALALSLFTLVLLGVFGTSVDGHHVLVRLRASSRARPIAFVFMGTLVVAVASGAVAQAAFVGRYTSAVFPLFILLAALGVTVFADRRVLAAVLAWTTVAGLIVGIGTNLSQRTEAGRVASVINKEASPNDVVIYCPDQLGPAVSRLLTTTVSQFTFPRADQPQRINWVDYRAAIHAANVEQFADEMLSVAAGHDIWFVQNPNYPGTEHKCGRLMDWLTARRNSQLWVAPNPGGYSEYESLVRFPE